MRRFGIIGYPLGHSFSRRYFTDKFAAEGISDAVYENYPLEDISLFPGLLKANPDLAGLNVTIPHKEQIIPYLDGLSPEAAEIGAVNCISFDDGRTIGYNTDIYGFRDSLLELIGEDRPSALLLGTGGASKAARYVLKGLGIDLLTVSRSGGDGRITYDSLDESTMSSHRLIVNTTPLGTYPDTGNCPDIPYDSISGNHYLFDLVYNPEVTEFMKRGAAKGARVTNGYRMLTVQAEKGWEIWNRVYQ